VPVLGLACAAGLFAAPAHAGTASFTTAGCSSFAVPTGVSSIAVSATGAAGTRAGGPSAGLGDGMTGTIGGLIGGTSSLYVCVNQGGGDGAAADGGGASGVSLGADFSKPVLVAGGGGGAGTVQPGGSAGTPVASSGANQCNPSCAGVGGNNTTQTPGAGGGPCCGLQPGTAGTAFSASGPGTGGNSPSQNGTGGGAGLYGGGGGGGGGFGGGGGGTDYCGDAFVVGAVTVTDCVQSAGAGTQTTAGAGTGFAKVTLSWVLSPTLSTSAPGSATAAAEISASALPATLAAGDTPTGTITFRVFGPSPTAPTDCSAGTVVGTATVAGNSVHTPSAGFTPTQGGVYWWYASYSGDANNAAAASTCGSAMPKTTVARVSTALSGTASDGIVLGGSVRDTAMLTNGASPTGQVTFHLYGPGDATCASAPVFTDTVPASGNGTYESAQFTPTALGTYHWIATYSGDATNQAATTACGDAPQTVAVTEPVEPPVEPAEPPAAAPPTPAIKVIGLVRDKASGSATLTVETTVPGQLRIAKGKKVKAFGPIQLDQAGSAELTVIPRRKAAKKLRDRGRVAVKASVLLLAADGSQVGLKQRVKLRKRR
jgi:hypothetical protein